MEKIRISKGQNIESFLRTIRHQKSKRSQHQKITTSKDHNIKRSQHQKITTSKDQNVKSDLPMVFGLLNLT